MIRFTRLCALTAAIASTLLAGPSRAGEEHRSLQPLSAMCFATPDSRGNARCTLTTVPAGKRLVTTSASYYASSSSPVVRAALLFPPNVTNLPVAAPTSNPATGTLYVTGLNISFIVEENTSVDFFMFGSNGNVEATINGYLVDK